MTCVVGISAGGIIYMGADSAGVNDDNVTIRADEKIFIIKNRFLIGYTSSFRMGQLLRFSLRPPSQKKGQNDYDYLCTGFINSVIKCFNRGGFGKRDEEEEISGGQFLVGYKGNIYTVDEDFNVGKPADAYSSVGCGQDFALGSLYTTEKTNLAPMERIGLALEAAAKFSTGVRPPFIYLNIGEKNKKSIKK